MSNGPARFHKEFDPTAFQKIELPKNTRVSPLHRLALALLLLIVVLGVGAAYYAVMR